MRVRECAFVCLVFFFPPVCCSKRFELVGILVTPEADWHAMCLQHCGAEAIQPPCSLTIYSCQQPKSIIPQKPQVLANVVKKRF